VTRRRERLATSPILGGTRAQLSMPDPARAAALLLLAQGSRLVRMDAVDPRFPAGGKQVRDLLALTGPASNGGRGAVLEIVRGGQRHPARVASPRAAPAGVGAQVSGSC
jgi:hypothetical protein